MKKEMRKCAVCGKKFTPKTANAVTCGEKCYKVRKAKLDKARKAKKVEAKPEAKKPVKAKAVEKIALPAPKKASKPAKVVKPAKGKACKCKCDKKGKTKKPSTVVNITGSNPFEVITIAFYIAVKTLDGLIKDGKLTSL